MKKVILIMMVGVLSGFSTMAQKDLKIGHINTTALIQQMPEFDQAQKDLQKSAKEHEDALSEMQMEFQNKYQTYQQKMDSLSPVMRQAKEKELAQMQQNIEEFRQNAYQSIENTRNQLNRTIFDKVLKAVNEVAAENEFTYILDASEGSSVLYSAPNSIDITSLVKKKLGMQ